MKRIIFLVFVFLFSFKVYSKTFDFNLSISNYDYLYNYNSTSNITNINLDFTYNYKKIFFYIDIPFSIESISLLETNDKAMRIGISDISTLFGYSQYLTKFDFNYYLGLRFNTRNFFYIKDSKDFFTNSDNNKTLYPFLRYQIVFSNDPFIIKPALEVSTNVLSEKDFYKKIICTSELQTICLMNKDISYFFILKHLYFFETNTTQIEISNSINFFINDKFYIRPGINFVYKNSSVLLGVNISFSF